MWFHTCPFVAFLAPILLAWINPSLLSFRKSFTRPFHCLMYSSKRSFRWTTHKHTQLLTNALKASSMYLWFYAVCEESEPTFVAEVVDHDDLSQVLSGSPLDDAVDGPHQCRPAFVVEDYHHTGGQQSVIIVPILAPGQVGQNGVSSCQKGVSLAYFSVFNTFVVFFRHFSLLTWKCLVSIN